MGKDLPGSPVTNDGVSPMDGIVWELNYRGKLEFLQNGSQAMAELESKGLLNKQNGKRTHVAFPNPA